MLTDAYQVDTCQLIDDVRCQLGPPDVHAFAQMCSKATDFPVISARNRFSKKSV